MKLHIPLLLRRVLAAAVVAVTGMAGYAFAATPGSSVTLAPLSVLDGASYHLDTLRSRIRMPEPCAHDKIGTPMMPALKDSLWASYVGGYNRFNGDSSHPSDYTRTFQGLLMGLDRQLCCNSLVGIAFGYEEAIARTSGARMDNDTYFIDLYGAVKTGCLNHRMSVGVGLHDFSSSRHGGWDVLDSASGGVDATSINVGYELSRDYVVDTRTTFTPFMMVNYSFSHYDALHEQVGSYSFESDFDDQNLLQVGLGARVAYKFNVMSDWEDATLTSSLAAVVEFSEHKVKGTHRFDDEAFGVSSMKREPFYGQLGFDLSMPMASQWEMQAGVYGRLGPDRGGVAGNVGLKYDF